mmetsp:Transcript_13899/g.50626  ORF Transcript_13899/g.50626 Transcript_13899/m.50626 type:complete len:620 (+) Transcript_13899:259-2118(+)
MTSFARPTCTFAARAGIRSRRTPGLGQRCNGGGSVRRSFFSQPSRRALLGRTARPTSLGCVPLSPQRLEARRRICQVQATSATESHDNALSQSGRPPQVLAFLAVAANIVHCLLRTAKESRAILAVIGVASLALFARVPAAVASTVEGVDGIANAVLAPVWEAVSKVGGDWVVLTCLLLGISFFSLAETSITTLWPWKVRELAEQEGESSSFGQLARGVPRFLSTILIGCTICSIWSAALATEIATKLVGENAVMYSTALMTLVVLIFCEILPKSVAVQFATPVARFVLPCISILSRVFHPISVAITGLINALLRLVGVDPRARESVSQGELRLVLAGAGRTGSIAEDEQEMMENVLTLTDTNVRDIMTPLVDVEGIEAGQSLEEMKALWRRCKHSRIPVFDHRVDNIIGIAYSMDLLSALAKQKDSLSQVQLNGTSPEEGSTKRLLVESMSVRDIMRQDPYFVPEGMSVWTLLLELRKRNVIMAFVVNEYGGTVGLVTMEDVIEEVVGEIYDEREADRGVVEDNGSVIKRAEGVYDVVDASTSMDYLASLIGVDLPEGNFETVAGYCISKFGRIPSVGEAVVVQFDLDAWEHEGDLPAEHVQPMYRILVTDADARKVC